MATAIHFGSHVYANSTYAQVCAVPVLKQRLPQQADVQHRIHHAMLLRVGQVNITKYDTNCEAAWADLDAKLPKYDLTYMKPFTNSKGFTKMKRESAFKIKRKENRLLSLAREEEIFQHMDPICVTNISIGGGSKPSIMPDPVIKWFPKRPCKIQKKNKVPRITGSHVVDNLSAALINVARQRKLTIELVDGKRSVKGKYENTEKGTVFRVNTLHAEHKIRQRDMASSHFLNKVIAYIGNKSTRSRWQPSDLKPGTSGFVLKKENLNIRVGRCYDGTLVVRGVNCGVLLDARSKITRHVMNSMKHFSSDPAAAFWRGFSTTFQQRKPQDLNHQCESNFSVEACGKVAAIVCQSLFPCGRITCKQCAYENEEQNLATLHTRLISVIKSSLTEVNEKFPEFTHVSNFLQLYCNLIDSHNGNFEAFSEVKRLIGHRQDAPFTHVLRVNEELIKGGLATSKDFAAATNAILEIARYLKNRTENIQKGSLTSFRNKVSQKSHLNLALMCDNQLDKNGNFIWGNRGFHAKRIFSNFFERVDMVKGYGHYENRLNPNGSRKIAIKRLIVSTNLATLRSQMKGEPVSRHPISKQCVSMLEGNFVYPCCCVTLDDGTPVESELRTPTKSHLVVGNAGDSKYVDLPDIEGGGLYIAKDGYCYTLLFLAMLVNVKEEEAKTFTKMVRDTIVPQLGQWPSMMDVATCCYMLTIFYPDTRGAELPRILVDHTHKVLHVIDSYGSISTGYHILKANTVNQLIQFASGELDSEIKSYIVGGTSLDHRPTLEQKSLKLLMKGIFNAEVMETIITEEPYILLLSILSPGVLLALYNSGSLEKATKIWVRSGSDLLNIATTLSTLATRVSVATSLVDQVSIIDSQADHIFNISFNGYKTYYSYNLALQVLQRVRARTETDSVLQSIGFNRYDRRTLELVEKNYLEELNQEWHELSWYGKCCAIMESRKQRGNSIKCLVPTKTADMKGRYDISLQSLLAERYQKMKRFICRKLNAIRERTSTVGGKVICGVVGYTRFLIPDFIRLINVLLVANLLIQLTMMCNSMLREHKRLKHIEKDSEANTLWKEMKVHYKALSNKLGCAPTKEEFIEYLDEKNAKLCEQFLEQQSSLTAVQFQAKKQEHQHVEQIIAFVTLVLMLFDSERSDCVFKTLNKLKGTMASLDNVVVHQGIDDIKDLAVEKNLTVDFVLDKDSTPELEVGDTTFEQWWQNRIQCGATLCHYRTEGFFMEFTRATAAQVASQISHDAPNDILIRGAVGSGKSTGLPYYLSKKGKVLILEPTRPLAENVCKQLRASPFHVNPTLMMRGLTSFGSTPITVMTSGFALHYFANNVKLLAEYQFVIIDECHVLDSNAMAFCSLLHEYPGNRKLIKVSATPPGREVDFSTQHPVTIKIEESLSFQQFVSNQGTGVNSDVISTCDNILVYVASYSEVDTLSKMLVDKGHKVTKVDGRTMKVGNVEILTSGSKAKKHFIVATNIIENGVTIDIDAVVDFGLKVTPILDVDNRLIRYQKNSISYGERIQRLGRVGRHKPGLALRIGHTEKGLVEIPTLTAIEAAFLCFTYNLPVMTHNVTTNLLSQCTVRQARTMNQFELNPLYTSHFVRFDGTMHPQVFEILKIYRLRDSEVTLNKMAIPNKGISNWISVSEYRKFGVHIEADDETRIPFHLKEVPDKIHMQMWAVVNKFKGDAGFGRLTSIQVSKIAYTLQTDILAIPRTIKILDSLIASEQMKKAQFTALFNGNTDGFGFTLTSILSAIRRRHMHDYTDENICKMQNIRAQLLEFKNLNVDPTNLDIYKEFGCLESVYHQSENQMSKYLKLRGVWNKSLIAQDVIIAGGVLGGGIWMLASHFKRAFDAPVYHQAKRKVQKLKFRQARDNKMKREFYGDDSTMDEYFGSAYTKKGKSKGTAVGSGKKNRRFVNMYGFDPSDFSLVRFVDPLTGSVLDESPYTDIMLVQEHFGDIRSKLIDEDRLEKEAIVNKPGIEAYYMKDLTSKAIKVDLTPHNPFRLCDRTNNISGFPEREGELRQSSIAKFVDASEVPENKEAVQHEGKALFKGLRDYNPIATTICQLTNNSDGHTTTLFGIGYGALIITNQHLFRHNNGQLTIKSHHGEFVVKNTTQLQFLPCEKRDIVVFRMPKDFPPFSQKLVFRSPESGERVCLVGSNFQAKSITSTVSETCTIFPIENTFFWKHWITTKDGNCGLPIVSTKDGCILGLHSLATITQTQNYFAAFPADFSTKYLDNQVVSDWVRNWKYNINKISWGQLDLHKSVPVDPFKISKLVLDLGKVSVKEQGRNDSWFLQEIGGNIKAVGQCDSQLVTKHAIHGKCPLFQTYLSVNKEANNFFSPLMGAYQKSRLNKEAYIKDAMKYSGPIFIGDVNCNLFERAISATIVMMEGKGFPRCTYITDEVEIIGALNMKAAVGALYQGRKREYFTALTTTEQEETVKSSCLRLYKGLFGVWNGSLKAELRPMEKVELNKTRSFTAAPLDTLLAGKVCVDDFNNHFYQRNIKLPWTVGMTKFYGGWNELLKELPAGWVYCDADGSQFDSSLSPYLINAVLQIRLHFMEDWDIGEQMLRNLYTEIVYTAILSPDGTIVKKYKGNNSGQPSTVVDNTLMVVLAMKYALMSCGVEPCDQDDMCKFFANGDDLIIALKPEFEWCLDTFGNSFNQLGLTYDFSSRTTDKTDLWFMSHRGILVEGAYIPKLEQERIVSILEWDRSNQPEHRLEAICASMVESWGYPQLTHEIRLFYQWVLEQAPFNALSAEGKAPYIAESALHNLYMNKGVTQEELEYYSTLICAMDTEPECYSVYHQATTAEITGQMIDAGVAATIQVPRTTPEDTTTQQLAASIAAAIGSSGAQTSVVETQPHTQQDTQTREATVSQRQWTPQTFGLPQEAGPIFTTPSPITTPSRTLARIHDRDVDVGTSGTFQVPRLNPLTSRLRIPMIGDRRVVNLDHLITYEPDQEDLANTRASHEQFRAWYEGVKGDYGVGDGDMQILLNGLMVWCIENGTSPNITGFWSMMDGMEQVRYPLKPILEHAQPTLRQIMAHFSDLAQAYIEKRNLKKKYMPRYGLVRNMTDYSLARYCFDFYEVNSQTPIRAREAHAQMKAAALRNAHTRMFGLDGNITTKEEDTERHTAEDVNRDLHHLMGVRGVV